MFGKYNGFVNKARVSACMYFLVVIYDEMESNMAQINVIRCKSIIMQMKIKRNCVEYILVAQ